MMKIAEILEYMGGITSTWFGVKRLARSHLEAHAEISQLKERIVELQTRVGKLETYIGKNILTDINECKKLFAEINAEIDTTTNL